MVIDEIDLSADGMRRQAMRDILARNGIRVDGVYVEPQDVERVKKRIPHECPFCKNIDNVSTTDFKVLVAYPFISMDGVWRESAREPSITVFCERCEEEIRPEDIVAQRGVENGE